MEKKIPFNNNFFKPVDRRKKEQNYLEKYIFYGLTDLNDGFDAKGIKYFSEPDFSIVLERVKQLGLGIFGIESWKDGEFYGVETYEEFANDPTDASWYLNSFERFIKSGDLIQYSATYFIPDKLIKE